VALYIPYQCSCDSCGRIITIRQLTLSGAMDDLKEFGWQVRTARKEVLKAGAIVPPTYFCPDCVEAESQFFPGEKS